MVPWNKFYANFEDYYRVITDRKIAFDEAHNLQGAYWVNLFAKLDFRIGAFPTFVM